MSARQLISLSLLCLQVAGVGHLAFDSHVIADDGAVVDAARLTADAHEGMHVCSPEVQGLGEKNDGCAVFAQLSAVGLISGSGIRLISAFDFAPLGALSTESRFVLSVLERAPKASPPALG